MLEMLMLLMLFILVLLEKEKEKEKVLSGMILFTGRILTVLCAATISILQCLDSLLQGGRSILITQFRRAK
jgi:predicted CDP-diglyceride synthetase/phosphatidate cytidylyltransferase